MLGATMLVFALACLHAASAAVAASRSVPSMRSRLAVRRSPAAVRMGAAESATEGGPAKWFAGGQTVGPQAPGQPADKPYTNMIKLNPVEAVKLASGPADKQLLSPLKEEMPTEEISISHDAVVVLKHHGSYQQQNRDVKGAEKAASYQFMLRLKMPNGECPPDLFLELDRLADSHGQGDLRATTRQAFQLHGVVKKDLKHVIRSIAATGASTLGGCGDINRNVMTPAARLPNNPAYVYAKRYASAFAELFKPSTAAFSELWLDGEKALSTEYWHKDLYHLSESVKQPSDIDAVRLHDTGRGVLTGHSHEPLYGTTYLPRKFKIGVTVPGDNSIDVLTNDLGLVVLMEADGKTLKGFNVYVGGGMGRTHNKESTFARIAEPLGFVPAEQALELGKAVLAAQRDHGNREVRANARMKYLVHTLGIEAFRKLIGSYMPDGKPLEPVLPMPPWVEGIDWLGWHAQGDGKWFVGINVQQGRIVDRGSVRLKSALRAIASQLGLTLILTAGQNVLYQDVTDEQRPIVERILAEHGVVPVEEVDMLVRQSMACPALPLCGLAQTEAERVMPSIAARLRATARAAGLPEGATWTTRVTGCPNGCARPYAAELALVGQGPDQYQVWVGGSPVGTRIASVLTDKMKLGDLEKTVEPLLAAWKEGKERPNEAFGDFVERVGVAHLAAYSANYKSGAVQSA